MTEILTEHRGPSSSLTLTARLNTSAMDSRRGVVRLHPEAIAALGIREWDAVSLMNADICGRIRTVMLMEMEKPSSWTTSLLQTIS